MDIVIFKIFVLCILIQYALAEPTTNVTSIDCQVPGNSTLDECLERFANKWDEIRRLKPHVDALVFPIMAMTPDDLKPLCSRIDEAQKGCSSAVNTCQSHEIARFVQKNFIYGCRGDGQSQSLFSEQADCLLGTTAGQQQCLMLLKKKEDQPGDQCVQVEEFFKCIQEEVYKSCQAKGLAALVHAIDRFGCDIKKLDATMGKPKTTPACPTDDWQAVAQCFQPLLTIWSQIRDNDTTYLDTAFPLFKFDRTDLVRMCDIVRVIRDRCFVQIQRCPGHQLPEFANAILGLACGTQQSAFFLNHDCIRGAISENGQCQPYAVGAWQPGHLKEICGRMPQYYKCLEKPVISKCGNEAVNVLAQAIRQYGCELNTDTSADSHHTIPSIIPETTTSIVLTIPPLTLQAPLSEGVLDFAGSPPSHTALPPAPPALGPPGFLDSQTSFFLAAPIPAAPLVPGVPETFFPQGPKIPAPPAPPAPPAAILLEPQSILAAAPNLPLPDKFDIGSEKSTPNISSVVTSTSIPISTAPTSPSFTSHSTSTPSKGSGSGSVVPIPNNPRLLDLCTVQKRNQLRDCLNPLYRRWVEVHGKMMADTHLNLTFPIYHYSKSEVVELCDNYASAFLRCPFSLFQECLSDDVVYLANAIFGYVCSPQNVVDFSRYFDCMSTSIRQRPQCMQGLEGALLSVAQGSISRCRGARQFYTCNNTPLQQSCTSGAQKVFAESVKQFGCDL